jgi:hypothetical protein
MIKTILGQKLTLGKKYVAQNNGAVLSYLQAAREGRGLAKETLSKLRKEHNK